MQAKHNSKSRSEKHDEPLHDNGSKTGIVLLNDMTPKGMQAKCHCGLEPSHVLAEHDWCCQICGGQHVERICPHKDKKTPKFRLEELKRANAEIRSKQLPKTRKAHILMPSVKELKKTIAKLEPSKKVFTVKFVQCQNKDCPFYVKRHRRFKWFSNSKLDKPSCPKCFVKNTQVLQILQAK